MIGRTIIFAAMAAASSAAFALSLDTLYARNNGGSNGGAVYFDVTVAGNDITITGFDTNTNDVNLTFGWTVFTRPGTHVGFTGSIAGWTQVATGTGTAMGMDQHSPVVLNNSFTLGASQLWGMALVIGPEAGHDYTNGTGANQNYSNSDLALALGSASNVAFSGSAFFPRVWNGTVYYDVVPEPASMAALGIGVFALLRKRRK